MADQQKPVEVPQDAPAVETPAETKPVEAEAAAAENKPAEDKPAETTEAPAAEAAGEAATEDKPAEDKKEEEPKPVEAGVLEHKGAGANFPKNLFFSKQPFWFGTDALEKNNLVTYLRHEKVTTVAHHNASWAQSTGKGLLCFGDKASPTGIINLAEATEPQTDGPNKFHFAANGQKHSFKAASKAEADNWVAQLKLKIAEAKEVATTIAEDETYKAALEGYKPPTPAKKEEAKPAEDKPAEATEAAPAEAATEATTDDKPAEEKEDESAKEEAKKDEEPKEEPKRRSLSRKRASYLNTLFGKKEKKEEKAAEPAAESPVEDKAAEPTPESPAAEAKPSEEVAAEAAPAAESTEDKPEEAAKEKPSNAKRNSFFGLLKKKTEAEAAPATPAKEAEAPASSETAPVIPPVETSASLSAEVATPAEAPAAEVEEAAPATNGEPKKEMKRKSTIPFLGKKDKAVTSDEEGEKPKSPSPFSRIRATLKGRSKSAEKTEVKAAEKTEESAEEQAEDKPATETAAVAEEPAAEASKAAEEEPENKPEAVAAAPAPAVTAAA